MKAIAVLTMVFLPGTFIAVSIRPTSFAYVLGLIFTIGFLRNAALQLDFFQREFCLESQVLGLLGCDRACYYHGARCLESVVCIR